MITENAVAVMVASEGRILRNCSVETTGPSAPKICFQARVLSKNEVKNGAITMTRRKFFHGPLLNAIAYASGYAIANASKVAHKA